MVPPRSPPSNWPVAGSWVVVCTAVMGGGACGAGGPGSGQTPQSSVTPSGVDPERTLGGSLARDEVVQPAANPTSQPRRCDDASFWDDNRCLPRREPITAENVAQVVPRCEAGDDQACPPALQQLRYNCELGVDEQCAAARRLFDSWVTRRDHRWAAVRCEVGQHAACLLAAEHERRRCLDGHTRSCSVLSQRVLEKPELQVELGLTPAERRMFEGAGP